jgi:hypothetical protein
MMDYGALDRTSFRPSTPDPSSRHNASKTRVNALSAGEGEPKRSAPSRFNGPNATRYPATLPIDRTAPSTRLASWSQNFANSG